MKPLNRPMFRYGGPIKEGVMSGIREPKKNGGLSKQFNTGLVGDERYPQTSGREHHWAFLGPMAMAGLRMAARPLGRFVASRFAGPVKQGSQKLLTTAANAGKPIKGGFDATKFQPNWAGKYLLGSPEGRFLTGTGAGWAGKAGKGIYAAGKGIAKSPLTLGGLVYMGGKWLWPDGTPANENEIAAAKAGRTGTSGAPGGGDPGMYLTPQGKQSGEGVTLSAEDKRKNQIQKYRDIMDIKGMNKKAAYDSLIAASQAINESGDFKGDIKSGKLINQIIQATSKQFDKPSKTKEAIDTLILQNELKKDLNKEENALANLLKQKQIQVADKTLKGDSTAEVIQAIALRTGMPQGDQLNQLVSLNNPELNLKTIPTKDMGQKDPITYIAEIVSSVNNDPKTPNYPAGNYVIKDKVVQITEDGSITPIPINALK